MDYLSKIKTTEGSGSGVIDDVNMTLTMALLYAIDATAISKVIFKDDKISKRF